MREDVSRLLGLLFQCLQIAAKNFDRQETLQSGFGFVYSILSGLGVVENDARERRELALKGINQFRFRVNIVMPGGVIIGPQPDIKLVVEESGWVGPVVGTS